MQFLMKKNLLKHKSKTLVNKNDKIIHSEMMALCKHSLNFFSPSQNLQSTAIAIRAISFVNPRFTTKTKR